MGTLKHVVRSLSISVLLLSFLVTSALGVNWPSWHDRTPNPHTIFGDPVYAKHDPNHNITRTHRAFTVYYDDTVLAPRWTAIKMTRGVADKNNNIKRLAKFKTDSVLKSKGYKVTKHEDYNNLKGKRTWDRGHMVQFDDARGYGLTAAQESFYTSNICPQLKALNPAGWLTLEETCTEFARDYEVVWIYTGPIYGESLKPFLPGRKIPNPVAFYKIVVSPGQSNEVRTLAFHVPHESIPRDVDLSQYLVSIDQIEAETNIDFLRELEDELEDRIEAQVGEMWPDLPNK